ncbi:hypothetical protein HY256_11375, partial [Candidatus Sumerlaeota bacterium]|nr:hypothetical protein [Candidatus Sumerlaeota bacterium]
MTRNSLIALIGLFILCSIAQGDAVTLKNGSVVEGRITKENEKEVVIEVDGIGTTFKKSEVAKIERDGKMEAEKADLAKTIVPHWRFKLDPGAIAWEDKVRGPVHFDAANLSDPVLVRADGRPIYTLATVVDDIDLAVTDV